MGKPRPACNVKGAALLVSVVSKGFLDTLMRRAHVQALRAGREMTLREVSSFLATGVSLIASEEDGNLRGYLQDLAHEARFRISPVPIQEIGLGGALLVFSTARAPGISNLERDYRVLYIPAQ